VTVMNPMAAWLMARQWPVAWWLWRWLAGTGNVARSSARPPRRAHSRGFLGLGA
jgi:hypothetical protein